MTELYPEDEATETKKKQLEDAILLMKALGGQAEAVKQYEEDLKNLQKKKQTRSLVNDGVAVAKSVQDVTEKAARMKSQAETRLEKKIADQSNLVKKKLSKAPNR